MKIKLHFVAEKANFVIDKQAEYGYTAKFTQIDKDGILEIELEFPYDSTSIVAQYLWYLGEDFMLQSIKKQINENRLPR